MKLFSAAFLAGAFLLIGVAGFCDDPAPAPASAPANQILGTIEWGSFKNFMEVAMGRMRDKPMAHFTVMFPKRKVNVDVTQTRCEGDWTRWGLQDGVCPGENIPDPIGIFLQAQALEMHAPFKKVVVHLTRKGEVTFLRYEDSSDIPTDEVPSQAQLLEDLKAVIAQATQSDAD